ncbi:hypothetical protein PVAP13_8KG327912 [Panicum virgatum]|uniref:Uncharacterized protein n=1 Tax=Panicum virgatum TaxID=38727 RepID=A0A8T0PT82_PANVG|nr:hypothetical protein PVAP13_8KG327912 [Panicum virgatum]
MTPPPLRPWLACLAGTCRSTEAAREVDAGRSVAAWLLAAASRRALHWQASKKPAPGSTRRPTPAATNLACVWRCGYKPFADEQAATGARRRRRRAVPAACAGLPGGGRYPIHRPGRPGPSDFGPYDEICAARIGPRRVEAQFA